MKSHTGTDTQCNTYGHTHSIPGGGGAYPEVDPNPKGAELCRDVLNVSYSVLTVSMSDSLSLRAEPRPDLLG